MESDEDQAPRRPWEVPRLTYVGEVTGIVQGGQGKTLSPGGDPGEPRKELPAM